MLLAIDAYYGEQNAKVVGVLFKWEDKFPAETISCFYDNVLPYKPGQFYQRELPCILELLKQMELEKIGAIIIDGHVFVSNDKTYGLGGYLWESLGKQIPIIGIAKRGFYQTDEVSFPVLRGNSKKPLYVSSIGYDISLLKTDIKNMHGNYRIPTILKILDQETRK